MIIIDTWRDDNQPVVKFEHNGNVFEIWWTSKQLVKALEKHEDGVSGYTNLRRAIDKARAPGLYEFIENPSVDSTFELIDDGEEDQGELEVMSPYGMIIVNPIEGDNSGSEPFSELDTGKTSLYKDTDGIFTYEVFRMVDVDGYTWINVSITNDEDYTDDGIEIDHDEVGVSEAINYLKKYVEDSTGRNKLITWLRTNADKIEP